jgi:hypothetical protein
LTKEKVFMSIEIIKIIFKKIRMVSTLVASWSIWIFIFFIFKNIKNIQIHGLTPKGQSSFFSKNTSKVPFLAQEAQTKKNYFFAFLTVRSCPRLLKEHVKKVLQKLAARIGKEEFFSLVPGRERSCPFFAKKQVSYYNFWTESSF